MTTSIPLSSVAFLGPLIVRCAGLHVNVHRALRLSRKLIFSVTNGVESSCEKLRFTLSMLIGIAVGAGMIGDDRALAFSMVIVILRCYREILIDFDVGTVDGDWDSSLGSSSEGSLDFDFVETEQHTPFGRDDFGFTELGTNIHAPMPHQQFVGLPLKHETQDSKEQGQKKERKKKEQQQPTNKTKHAHTQKDKTTEHAQMLPLPTYWKRRVRWTKRATAFAICS